MFLPFTFEHCNQIAGAVTKSARFLKKKVAFEQNFRVLNSPTPFATWERKELLAEEEKLSITLATMTIEQKERSKQLAPGTI
jgi:hypothetical protein